jgi:homoserine O-acetyltransferase
MGGMQAFQWLVSYPNFMDKAVPIVGSPRLAPYDLMLWQAQIEALMRDRDWRGGNYTANPARALDFAFGELLLTTPTDYNRRKLREQVFADLEKARRDAKRFDANDKIRQTQAMMSLDVLNNYRAVKAKVLVVVARFDHVVTPGPASEFATLVGAKLVELEGDCGHLATSCESRKLTDAVNQFLNADDTDR